MVLRKPIYLLRVTVWCSLRNAVIIDPYFFENENGSMITNFLLRALHGIDENDILFQQDDATCYTSHATIDLYCQTFEGSWTIFCEVLKNVMPTNQKQLSI